MADTGRVDFYVLAQADAGARRLFACRLAEKVYHLGQTVHIHADGPAEAAELDTLLWTFRQGSFLPHEVATADRAPASPVTIGHGPPPRTADLLVNLASGVPPFAAEFPRVADVVDASEDGRQLGRQRFRAWREGGREPVTHTLGAAP